MFVFLKIEISDLIKKNNIWVSIPSVFLVAYPQRYRIYILRFKITETKIENLNGKL